MSLKEYSADAGTTLADHTEVSLDMVPATQAAGTFAMLARANVVRSLTNPRKHFDAAYIQELAESAKAHGIIQPLLLRPLPGSRVADTPRHVTHEIVCGECRDRASEVAGLLTYPVMIKNLSDDEVLEIQLVENLKRRDLTPLEEAEGYHALMQHSKFSARDLAAKISMSHSYVLARLKLLDLCPEARTMMREELLDASRALLVARIPDHKLQIKAIKEIIQGNGWGDDREPMSAREAARHIQHNYMVKLDTAKFNIEAIDLVPAAGSCKTCTKRTGHSPDLFSEVKSADVCTDPPCFHKKEEAHAAQQVQQAKAKGQTVIAGKAALELMPQPGYAAKFKGYKRLDSVEDSPTDKPLRKIIGKQMANEGIAPIMIEHPHRKNEMVAALPNETVARLLKTVQGQAEAAKAVNKEAKQFADEKKAKAERKLKDQFEQGWRNELMLRTWTAMCTDGLLGAKAFTLEVHRYLALREVDRLTTDDAAFLCKLMQLGKVAPGAAVRDYIKGTGCPDLFLMLLLMLRDSGVHAVTYDDDMNVVENQALMLIAGNVHGSKLQSVISQIKAEVQDQLTPPKALKTSSTEGPAAQATGAGGSAKPEAKAKKPAPLASGSARKAKLSAQEAITGIAAAMQGMEAASADAVAPLSAPATGQGADQPDGPQADTAALPFPVGTAVRIIKNEDKLQMRLRKHAGKAGTVTALLGVNVRDVSFKGRTGGIAAFDLSELEAA